jgi:hypothetical protein
MLSSFSFLLNADIHQYNVIFLPISDNLTHFFISLYVCGLTECTFSSVMPFVLSHFIISILQNRMLHYNKIISCDTVCKLTYTLVNTA